MQVRQVVGCGRRVSINQQFVPYQYAAHLKRYRGLEERRDGGHFPLRTLDQGLLQASSDTPPLLTSDATLEPAPIIDPIAPQFAQINFRGPPVGRPPQDDPMIAGWSTDCIVGKDRCKYHPGFSPLHPPNGTPTQNPEGGKKAEVRLCLPCFQPAFLNNVCMPCRLQHGDRRKTMKGKQRFGRSKICWEGWERKERRGHHVLRF